ncbi:antitoxin [Streptomyces lavendulae]|uniref:antitoxin n=1 Tax=Streptomyces lavendulae TaxID=1914 RepID=UPI003408E734
MGLLDSLKAKLSPAKVGNLAQQHEAGIGEGLDKVAKAVDSKTKGKYRSHIADTTGKAKDALGKIARRGDAHGPKPGGK